MTNRDAVTLALFRAPGSVVEEIAEAAFPMPPKLRIGAPFTSAADRAVRLAARNAWLDERAVGRRVDATKNALDELVRRGLVERCRPPTLAAWFVARSLRLGALEALRSVYRPPELCEEVYDPHPTGPEVDRVLAAWARMIAAYGESPGVWRPGDSGAEQETYAVLVERTVFESSRQRWLTAAGEARAMALLGGA